MYTRIYGADEKTVSIPENYDGNAFREEPVAEEPKKSEPLPAPEVSCGAPISVKEEEGVFASLLKRLPIQSIFGNLGIKSLSSFKIGSEEILIVGIALFLFFSKGGDNELAFMLLLLLFVN